MGPGQRRPRREWPATGGVDQDHPGQGRPAPRIAAAGEVDQAAVALAARQGGVFAREQLRGLGMSRGALEHRLATGRYVAVHRGVYAIAGVPLGMRGRTHAAQLAGGPGAAPSHRLAGAEWAIRAETHPPEITVPGPRRASRADLIIHTSPPFGRGNIVLRDGLRVTSPVRTLLDLAAVEPAAALERAVAEAQLARLLARERERRAA